MNGQQIDEPLKAAKLCVCVSVYNFLVENFLVENPQPV